MYRFLLTLLAVPLVAGAACAGATSRAAAEAAEHVLQRFGKTAVREGTEVLASRIEAAAASHGGEVIGAVRRVGPRALPLIEQAAAHGPQAAKAIARHGEAGAWVAARPRALSLVAKHGDEAAAVLCKHSGGVAEPVVEAFGTPAVRALSAVGPRSGRRVAMMLADGELQKIGRTPEVLEVIGQYGEKAASFIWDNKGALMVGGVLASFLADPAPYLAGVKSLTDTVAVNAVRPAIEEGTREVAHEVARSTNWTLIFLVLIGLAGAVALGKGWIRFTRTVQPAPATVAGPIRAKEGGGHVVEQ